MEVVLRFVCVVEKQLIRSCKGFNALENGA